MKKYRVMPEHWDRWFGNLSTDEIGDAIVTETEIRNLAADWSVSVEDLMEEVEEIQEPSEAQTMIDAGLYDAAVQLMDDDIREEIHRDLAPCSDEKFLAEYMKRHEEKYGEPFTV